MLFRECLEKLVNSIQSMKTSEDIQSGIYLDVMSRREKSNSMTTGRYSTQSKISETIHNRFGSSHV